jgi:hypothetical protein
VALSAENSEFAVRVGADYSDNATRTNTNEISTGAAVAGVQLAAQRPSGPLRFDVRADLSYYNYFDNAVGDEVLGSVAAAAAYEFLPERFSWDLRANFDQIQNNLLLPLSPNNREDVTSLTTGPVLRARLGEALQAELKGRYSITDYSKRDFDNDTVGAQLVVGHRYAAHGLIGAGGAYDKITYRSSRGLGAVDFDRREAFARLESSGARTSFTADAGYSQVKGGSIDDHSALYRLGLTRRLTPFISGHIELSQEFPTSEAVANAAAAIGATAADAILTAAPRLARTSSIGFTMDRSRTTADLAYVARRETGALTATGRRSTDEVRGRIARKLTPRAKLTLFADYLQDELSVPVFDANEFDVGGEFSVNFGRSLGLDLRIEHRNRSSSIASNEFSELSGGIFIRYGQVTPANFAPLQGAGLML